MPKTWFLRVASGKGIGHDKDISVYQELSASELEKLTKEVDGRIGAIQDFLAKTDLEKLAGKPDLGDKDVNSVPTSWKGTAIKGGQRYVIVDDPDKPAGEAVTALLKESLGGDRVVRVKSNLAFSTNQQVMRHIGENKAPEGGIWGVKRQGPPRI
jgi:hypothetical protein